MTSRTLAVIVALLCAPGLLAQSAVAIQKSLSAESERLGKWAGDKVLLDATKAQNAKKVALADIQKIDEEWNGGNVRKELTAGTCADRLRQLMAAQSYYVEAFVTDNQGAIVCANAVTSDYWQGDEPKWQRAFNGGQGRVFIDRPRFDESAKATLGTISIPMNDGATTIGVIVVGVVTEKLPASD